MLATCTCIYILVCPRTSARLHMRESHMHTMGGCVHIHAGVQVRAGARLSVWSHASDSYISKWHWFLNIDLQFSV